MNYNVVTLTKMLETTFQEQSLRYSSSIPSVSLDILLSKNIDSNAILHRSACGLTFLAFFLSVFMLVRSGPHLRSRVCSGFTLAAAVLAAVVTTVVFLVDVIFVAIVRKKLRDETDGDVNATWGVGVSSFPFLLLGNAKI